MGLNSSQLEDSPKQMHLITEPGIRLLNNFHSLKGSLFDGYLIEDYLNKKRRK